MNKGKYNKRRIGNEQEEIAVHFLQAQGMEIVERNFYCSYGEIDIVYRDGRYLVFGEVKYRKNRSMGSPEEAIQPYKIQRIVRSAQYYLYKKGYHLDTPVRFDAIVILGTEVYIIKNAFEAG